MGDTGLTLLQPGCLLFKYYKQCVSKDVSKFVLEHARNPFPVNEANTDHVVVLAKARSFAVIRMPDLFLHHDRAGLWEHMMSSTIVEEFRYAPRDKHVLLETGDIVASSFFVSGFSSKPELVVQRAEEAMGNCIQGPVAIKTMCAYYRDFGGEVDMLLVMENAMSLDAMLCALRECSVVRHPTILPLSNDSQPFADDWLQTLAAMEEGNVARRLASYSVGEDSAGSGPD